MVAYQAESRDDEQKPVTSRISSQLSGSSSLGHDPALDTGRVSYAWIHQGICCTSRLTSGQEHLYRGR